MRMARRISVACVGARPRVLHWMHMLRAMQVLLSDHMRGMARSLATR
jgi:hypothetical protein